MTRPDDPVAERPSPAEVLARVDARLPRAPIDAVADPVGALAYLGAVVSPAVTGDAPLDQYACVLCRPAACNCAETEFGSPEYMAKIDRLHGPRRGGPR
jgi:hypothetical protein